MTAPQRLRLAVARLVGERTMLRLARWACPSCCDVHYRAACDAVVHAYRSSSDLLALRAGEQYHKRRALARRRWGRRGVHRVRVDSLIAKARGMGDDFYRPLCAVLYVNPRPLSAREMEYAKTLLAGAEVKRGELVYAHGGKWWPSNRPTVCQEPGQYLPASACDLGYEVSGDGPRRE